jgi:tetratricopeptide (TPR) repeat protein
LYTRLRSGRLGYERIAQFKQPASILGYTFDSEDTDPTLTAFDRPTVEVYRRTPQYDSVLVEWKQLTISDRGNPDNIILEGIAQFKAGAYQGAQQTFEQAMREYPELKLAQLCRVEAIYRYQTSRKAQEAFEEGSFSQWDFAGLSLAGIPERGAEYSRITLVGKSPTPENLYLRQLASKALIDLGAAAHESGEKDLAIDWYQKALELDRKYLGPFRGLAAIYLERERFEDAVDASREALKIAPRIGNLWVGLAIAESRLGNAESAYQAALKAIPLLRDEATYDPVFADLEAYFRSLGENRWADDIRAQLIR